MKLEIQVAVQELRSGALLAFPVAAPQLAVFDLEGAWQDELRRGLEAFLPETAPSLVAALTLWRGELLEVAAPLPLGLADSHRADPLPTTLDCRFPCLVRREGKDRWIRVLGLGHDFWAGPGDELTGLARREILRCLQARLAAGEDARALLPPLSTTLELLEVAGRGPKVLPQTRPRQRDLEILRGIGSPLEKKGGLGRPDSFYPRPALEARARTLLLGKNRRSLVVAGPEGSGKSALIEHVLAGRADVFLTSGFEWVAGQSMFGQLQERVREVMGAAERLDAILYFPRFEELLTGRQGSDDLISQLRPYLERGRVRVLCELSTEQLAAAQRSHTSFFAATSQLEVAALAVAETRELLVRRLEPTADAPTRVFAPDLADHLLELCQRYYPEHALPGWPLRLVDALEARRTPGQDPAATLGSHELFRLFSARTGIPEFLLREDQALRRAQLQAAFRAELVGQHAAVEQLVSTLCAVKARLQPEGRPLAVLLFIGPTGVGKTEAARALTRLLFGDERRLVRFDMSEYSDPWAADRLIRGTDRDEGLLTRRIRREPFAVILLDEIEKADPSVFDLLLQVAGEGRLTDARGRTAHFHNTVLILTSNLGAAAESRQRTGFATGELSQGQYYQEQVEQFFRPELVNRLDRVIRFLPLDATQLERIAELQLAALARRRGFEERAITLEWDDDALRHLAKLGHDASHGARRLRRHLQRHVTAPAARLLAQTDGRENGPLTLKIRCARPAAENTAAPSNAAPVVARAESAGLVFELSRRPAARTAGSPNLAPLQDLRRLIHRLLSYGTLEALADEITSLRRQRFALNQRLERQNSTKKSQKAPDGAWVTEYRSLSQHLHRLEGLLEPLLALAREVEKYEELALAALLATESAPPWPDELDAWVSQWRRGVAAALLLQDEIPVLTLSLAEGDAGGAFGYWLGPLLAHAEKAEWPLSAWPFPAKNGDVVPSLSLPELREWLSRPSRSREILLECRSPTANARLRWEAGWHRFAFDSGGEPTHLQVQRVAQGRLDEPQRQALFRARTRQPLDPDSLRRLPKLRSWLISGDWWQLEPAAANTTAFAAAAPLAALVGRDYWQRLDEILAARLMAFELDPELDRTHELSSQRLAEAR